MEELDPDEVISLERKLTRAMQHDRGITLKPKDLNLLAVTGALDRLAEIKVIKIKEKIQWRREEVSINEGRSGSIAIAAQAVLPRETAIISTGIAETRAGSAARARASAIFG